MGVIFEVAKFLVTGYAVVENIYIYRERERVCVCLIIIYT